MVINPQFFTSAHKDSFLKTRKVKNANDTVKIGKLAKM